MKLSRQSYYRGESRRQRRRVDEKRVVELIRLRRQRHPVMGGRKLYAILKKELQREGIKIGRDRFFEVMGSHGLLVKRRRRPRTTDSKHHYHVPPNLMRDRVITSGNRAWVSDMTYVDSCDGFVYLASVLDAYTRKVVGYHSGDNMEASGCLKALQKATQELRRGEKPIHHSDRAKQYCSRIYVKWLKRKQMKQSMTEQNHCYENAQAERLNGILKHEYGLKERFASRVQAKQAIDEAIELYNQERPHLGLDYLTPSEAHRKYREGGPWKGTHMPWKKAKNKQKSNRVSHAIRPTVSCSAKPDSINNAVK